MSQRIVGVDIGATTIRAVEVQDAAGATPTVLGCHEIDLPEGATHAGEVIEVNTVADALRRLWKAGGIRTRDVVLGMGNHRVMARDLTVPRLPLKRLREALPYQVQDMLPVPVAEALLDFYPISEGESDTGPVINGLLIAAVKESVDTKVTAARLAGLNPVAVDLVPFALSRLLVAAASGSVALVDVGETTTTVVVAADGIPRFVRIIPAGGRDVTAALVERLGVPRPRAEALKRAIGMSPSAKVPDGISKDAHELALEVIFTVSSELLSGLRNTLNYYAGSHQRSVERILITGGAAKMPGFAEALSELTRIPAFEASAFASVSVAKSVVNRSESGDWGSMTVALGLAVGSRA